MNHHEFCECSKCQKIRYPYIADKIKKIEDKNKSGINCGNDVSKAIAINFNKNKLILEKWEHLYKAGLNKKERCKQFKEFLREIGL